MYAVGSLGFLLASVSGLRGDTISCRCPTGDLLYGTYEPLDPRRAECAKLRQPNNLSGA